MKINFKFLFYLFGLLIIVLSKDTDQEVKITIKTVEDDSEEEPLKEEEEGKVIEKKEKIVPKRDNAQSTTEEMIQEARKNARLSTTEKSLILKLPYEDNEDYILAPLGLGSPVNFYPLQVDTTTYKTWVLSVLNEDNPSIFNYNLKESSSAEESGDWETVKDEEGTINGNVILDKAYLGKYKIDKFKFIEGVEFEEGFKDYKHGKLGLGNCKYAEKEDKEFCLLERLKNNGSIDRKLFSIKESGDTHGEIVIGDISANIKDKNYPLLNIVDQSVYDDIEDDVFKMGWLTRVSHVLFRNNSESIKKIFENNIPLKDGYASFDSGCHYIEAPYSYINDFEDQMFDVYYDNVCRKVNRDGTYMFLCDKERYNEVKGQNKNLSFIIVLNGYGFEIPMHFLFEQTTEDDYEFFIHFKDYEQNIWNLGHPFFHYYTVIFDQDNQEIGIDGEMIYSLQDETEAQLKRKKSGGLGKVLLWILFGLLLLVGLFLLARKFGIDQKLKMGINPSLVDNESNDDLSFAPGENVH